MKLALVCKSFRESRGGHEKYLNRMIPSLVERDHTVHIISQEFNDKPPPNNIQEHPVRGIKIGGFIRRLSFNYLARKKTEELRDDVDLVFTTGKVTFGDVYRAGGGVHKHFLQNCGGPFEKIKPKHIISCRLQKKLFSKNTPRKIIVNSKMVKTEIMDEFNVDQDRIEVIYNGINTDRFNFSSLMENRSRWRESEGFDDSDIVALCVAGGDWKRKGLPTVLQAFRNDIPSDLKLLIVGRTSSKKVHRRIKQYGLEGCVKLRGYTENIEKFYTLSDFLVFPSRYDAGSSVVIEALACGLPVITSKQNGTHELIESTKNGWLVDQADDHYELSQTIKTALKFRADWSEMRRNASETGKQYTLNNHVNQIEDVLIHASD